jgi:hypothetical protein
MSSDIICQIPAILGLNPSRMALEFGHRSEQTAFAWGY